MVTIKQHKTSEEKMEIIEMSESQSFKFLKSLGLSRHVVQVSQTS